MRRQFHALKKRSYPFVFIVFFQIITESVDKLPGGAKLKTRRQSTGQYEPPILRNSPDNDKFLLHPFRRRMAAGARQRRRPRDNQMRHLAQLKGVQPP